MTSAFADTLGAIRGEADESALVAGRPSGDRWVRLDDALRDDGILRRWLDATRTGAEAPDRVAMMFLSSWLTSTFVEPLATSLVRSRRGWITDRSAVFVRPTDGGWFDGLAIEDATVLVLADDGPTDREGVRVLPSIAAIRDASAASIAPILGVTLAALRRVGPLGAPAFWGSVADSIADAAVSDATSRGADPTVAFAAGASLSDAIGRQVGMGRVRPTLVTVPWSGGVAHEVRRGTCCLWYQTQEAPDPRGEGYCGSCPRRDADDQRQRWARWLDEEATTALVAG